MERRRARGTGPRLSFNALPAQRPDPAGMATPPIHLPGSVPFWWEETPGKPKRELGRWPATTKSSVVETKAKYKSSSLANHLGWSNTSGHRASHSCTALSWEEGRDLKVSVKKYEERGGGNKERRGRKDGVSVSPSPCKNGGYEEREEETKVDGLPRSMSVHTNATTSHWLVNIYGNLKQVVRR